MHDMFKCWAVPKSMPCEPDLSHPESIHLGCYARDLDSPDGQIMKNKSRKRFSPFAVHTLAVNKSAATMRAVGSRIDITGIKRQARGAENGRHIEAKIVDFCS